ncbi:MAG: hypothetical protein ACI8Y4_001088 [Candidatus Poriferisodalaceae bacterium]|jgi:hypothetical protein
MFLWFAGTALVAMWFTFRDPAIDHRLIVVGALLPDLVDAVTGSMWIAHTVFAPTATLFIVMGATGGRRQARRRYLAVPIGMFFHLVFDGAFQTTSVFWWPVNGSGFGDVAIPAFERPIALTVVMEVVGALCLMWAWRRFGLIDPARRLAFMRSGRIDRALTNPEMGPPSC